MPFNGSGVFQRVRNWVADATAGIKIRADFHDAEDDGFAAGLSNCITKDGQTTITQNIPFNNKRITGLADPVNDQDAVTKKSLTGGITMTGPLILKGDPTADLEAAPKQYVDKRLALVGGQTTTGGFNFTPYNQPSGSFTVDPWKHNYQYWTCTGASTITAPASDCAVDILVTNSPGGAITFSGFTVNAANAGDPLTTTNGHRFIVSIRRIASISTYVVKALQ